MNKDIEEIEQSKKSRITKLYRNIDKIYWPENFMDYFILNIYEKDSSIQYSNFIKHGSKTLIETSKLDNILSISSEDIEVEVGVTIDEIEKRAKFLHRTILPFEPKEVLKEISFFEDGRLKTINFLNSKQSIEKYYKEKSIYSLKYKLSSIENSNRVFYQYNNLSELLNDTMKVKNFKIITIYNNYFTLMLKYDGQLLFVRKVWKEFRTFFYYETSLKKRKKMIFKIKKYLKRIAINSSIAINYRDEDEFPLKRYSSKFSKKENSATKLFSFLNNEFMMVKLFTKKIDLLIDLDKLYSFMLYVENLEEICFYEIKIFKHQKAKINILLISSSINELNKNIEYINFIW